MTVAVDKKSWVHQSRHTNRGAAYLFGSIADFNGMPEVGGTPP
ncbi:hypothetical protein [Trichocoleus sp. FACHB-90]|nr:hypothetical protein [Trichocoleus sp. FACHB-90]